MYRQVYDRTISLTEKGKMRFKKGSIRIPIRIYNSQSDYFSTFDFDTDFLSLRLFFCILTTLNTRIWIVLLLRMHQDMTNANIGV